MGVVYKVDSAGRGTVLYTFTGGADGGKPMGGVIADAKGNLYGTANIGGAFNSGVVFKIDTTGKETVVYSFTGGPDGGYPSAGLIADRAGNLYGTASYASIGLGVVFKLDPSGQETVLHTFTGPDGATPLAPLFRDASGNLYGTTSRGGSNDFGVVFKIDTAGNETMVIDFYGTFLGLYPVSPVVVDSAGNIYGTTPSGGTFQAGSVYKIDSKGQGTLLYSFIDTSGYYPIGNLILDSKGNLFGTTTGGGASNSGIVFKISPSGQETTLYSFNNGFIGAVDGRSPGWGLIHDSAGNFYGTTTSGGTGNCGAIFKLDLSGHESVVYSFPGVTGGASPTTGLHYYNGSLFGTTSLGGANASGVIFRLDAAGNETVLYTFSGGTDGGNPTGGVIQDAAGDLYGLTVNGGSTGMGVIYKVTPAGQLVVLHTFAGGTDGAHPQFALISDSAGNLYGTTAWGGLMNGGTIFKLDASGNETVLHSFSGLTGDSPSSGLLRSRSGDLYGTESGEQNNGAVFKLDQAGNYSYVYSFKGGLDGSYPYGGVISDSSGNLYGVASGGVGGEVFKIDTAGHETTLYAFGFEPDGDAPGQLVLDSQGNLYGATTSGGQFSNGTVFKLDPAGHETILYNFTGAQDGSLPDGTIARDPAGNLYGTTSHGGAIGAGVVFKVTP